VRHREHHPVRQIELPLIVIDHDAQVVEVLLARVHDRFPNRAFLELTVAAQTITIERRRPAADNREALCYGQSLTHRPRREMNTREQRSGMAVQDALVRSGVVKNRAVEVTELSVDRRHCGYSVTLAEDEQILAALRGIDDINIHEAAVVQRHQRNRRRERATGVEALVDGVAPLIQRRKARVRILDPEQLQDPLPQKIQIVCGKWLDASTQIQFGQILQKANRSASCISRGWFT
jgi:hypothetical protein